MKWFLPSFWLSLLMGRRIKSEVSQPLETSTDALSSQKKSSVQATKRGRPKGSTNKTKSKRGVNQSSSPKKQNSGTKRKTK